MPTKYIRLTIPILVILLLSLGKQVLSSGLAPTSTIYLPIVSYDLTGWIGPYGGTIVTTAVDPTNPMVIYAGTFGTGVFKSVDGGENWFSINQGIYNLQIYSLAIDPIHPSTLFAGTYHSQIFKSTDGGSSWSWSGTGMQDPAIVYSLAIDPLTPMLVYASTRGESNNGGPPWRGILYKSSDGGNHWSPSLTNVGGSNNQDWAYSIAINPNQPQQVFAAYHEWGPWRSDDAGVTWNMKHEGMSDWSSRSIVISPQPEFASTLYQGLWHSSSVLKSINNGDLWTGANQGIPNVKVYSMALDPFSAKTLYVASFSHGILRTFDGGNNWQLSGLQTNQVYSVSINPMMTNNLFAGTAGDGVYRSLDYSSSWQHSDVGINNATVTSVVYSLINPNTIYSSIYGGGVYQSSNHGQTWEEINQGLEDKYVHALAMDPSHPGLLYALTESGGLFQNDLTIGAGWKSAGQGLPVSNTTAPAFPENHPFATLDMLEHFATPPDDQTINQATPARLLSIAYAPSNPSISYMGTGGLGLYKSADGGLSWKPTSMEGRTIYSLAVDKADPNLVYAATDLAGTLIYSVDGGTNWKNAPLAAVLYSVAASPTVSGIVYVGTNTGIYRYQSGSFSPLGLSDQTVTAIGLESKMPGVIFAGTTTGAYYSPDAGITWKTVDNLLQGQTIMSIGFDRTSPSIVYFCTKLHGIYMAAIH
jgi:photosystem II stability/assembly factor-like uncharacterized protein